MQLHELKQLERIQKEVEKLWFKFPEFIGVRVEEMVYTVKIGYDRFCIYRADYFGEEAFLMYQSHYSFVDVGHNAHCVLHKDEDVFRDFLYQKEAEYYRSAYA